jgi:anti-anti-sigma factor
MSGYHHLELLRRGPVSLVHLRNHRPFRDGEVAELAREWNSVADRADCHTLFVDCCNVQLLSSDMLSKLILLRRRLKEKEGRLVLCGLRAEVREVLNWTKLDRFFEVQEDERPEAASLA